MADNTETSFSGCLKQNMREIYELHLKFSRNLENKIVTLEEENSQLQRLIDRLRNDVQMLRKRLNSLQNENNRLTGDLFNTSSRLSAPCENCKSLIFQIEQQNKLICQLMEKHDLSISIIEKYLGAAVSAGDRRSKAPSVLQSLSQALNSQNVSVKKSKSKSEKTPTQEEKVTTERLTLSTSCAEQQDPSTKRSVDNLDKEGLLYPARLEDGSKRSAGQLGTDSNPEIRVENENGEETSPNSCKLKLNRKRTRHKYVEESKSKKPKQLEVPKIKTHCMNPVAPQSAENNPIVKNRKTLENVKVVPETVPAEEPLDSDVENNSEISSLPNHLPIAAEEISKDPINFVMKKTLDSDRMHERLKSVGPPSYFSTPLPVHSDEEQAFGDRSVEVTEQRHSASSSPVFGKPSSPLLFEDSVEHSKHSVYESGSANIAKLDDVVDGKENEQRSQVFGGENIHVQSFNDCHTTNERILLSDEESLLMDDASSLLLHKPSSSGMTDLRDPKSKPKNFNNTSILGKCKSNHPEKMKVSSAIRTPQGISPSILSGKFLENVVKPKHSTVNGEAMDSHRKQCLKSKSENFLEKEFQAPPPFPALESQTSQQKFEKIKSPVDRIMQTLGEEERTDSTSGKLISSVDARSKSAVQKEGLGNRNELNGTVDPHVNLADYDTYAPTVQQDVNVTISDEEEQVSSNKENSEVKYWDVFNRSKAKSRKTTEEYTDNDPIELSHGKSLKKYDISMNLGPETNEECEELDSSVSSLIHGADNSFDRLPSKTDEINYKYVKVVRKREERQKLDAYVCIECDKWFNGMGLTPEEKKKRMKAGCKHKAMFAPPETPDHYWSVGFPDTQQCKERGYMNTTHAKPSKYRRNRPFKQLFRSEDSSEEQ